jgi:predicted permease
MRDFLQDIRYAWRGLRRAPGFTAAAVATLALSMGATTAIFSVIRAVLFSPLPYSEPERSVMIWTRWVDFPKTWVSDGELRDYRQECPSFENVAVWESDEANLTGAGEPARVGAAAVTANVFDALGAKPQLGRGFTEEEDRPGGPPVAVLGWGLWQASYGGDPSVIGRTVELDGVPRRVVGVMPRGFALPTDFTVDAAEPKQIYVPVQIDFARAENGNHNYYAAARLRRGATVVEANAEIAAVFAHRTKEGVYPAQKRFTAFAVPLDAEIRGGARRALYLVFGAVGFLLLMACANVANLLLARAEGRQREISVRAAIGAGKARLVRQLLTESLVLSAVGGVLGLGVAWIGVRLIAARGSAGLPALAPLDIQPRILLFSAALAVGTTLLFGLAPALRLARLDLAESMRDGAGGATAGLRRHRLRGALAVVQIALAVVLLLGAGLMIRTLAALSRVDLGFDPQRVLTLQLRPPEASYPKPEQVVAFYRTLLDSVRGLPGVKAAGLVRSLPLGEEIGDWGVEAEGYVHPPDVGAKGDWQVLSDGALEALGEKLKDGRTFQRGDVAGSLPVALVNETFARIYWPGKDPLGRRIRMNSSAKDRPWMTVVGIVRNVRHNGVTAPIKEKFYVPAAQFPQEAGFAARNMNLVVRSSSEPLALVGAIRAAVARLDPNLPIARVRPMTRVVEGSLATPRLTGFLLTTFAAVALTLAAVGISGVLAYLVSLRRREIGIRMALGASRGRVLGLVVRRGMEMAGVGIAAGLLAALFLARLFEGMLYGIEPRDPATFAFVALLFAAIAAAATGVPALRAARTDPLEALRSE